MITVVGSSNTDFCVKVDSFPKEGETVLGSELFISGGGKGANQAACIAKLGGKVNFISNIGNDYFGKISIRNLSRVGVYTRFVKRDKTHHSGAAVILVTGDGKNMITVSPGSNSFLRLDDVLRRASCIKESKILLLQLEIPLEAVNGAIYIAKRFNKLTILNPAPACKLSKDILSKVDVLIPNEIELSMLTGARILKKASLIKAANLLLNIGVGCVIITRGRKGALLVTNKKIKFFKARKAKVVDTTCAGDAFCGAVALGLDKGKSIEEAIEFANGVAALTVTKLGAQCSLPTRKDLRSCNFLS